MVRGLWLGQNVFLLSQNRLSSVPEGTFCPSVLLNQSKSYNFQLYTTDYTHLLGQNTPILGQKNPRWDRTKLAFCPSPVPSKSVRIASSFTHHKPIVPRTRFSVCLAKFADTFSRLQTNQMSYRLLATYRSPLSLNECLITLVRGLWPACECLQPQFTYHC